MNLDNNKHSVKNGELSRDDILVLENSETPTVFARGDLVDYLFVENQQTGENELYVKLLAMKNLIEMDSVIE